MRTIKITLMVKLVKDVKSSKGNNLSMVIQSKLIILNHPKSFVKFTQNNSIHRT